MYLGNFDYFDSFTCVNEHYGTEYMGKTRTNSNLTQGRVATFQVRLRPNQVWPGKPGPHTAVYRAPGQRL